MKGVLKTFEDIYMQLRENLKASNQRCDKNLEKHVRRLDLHDTALNNIETQLG